MVIKPYSSQHKLEGAREGGEGGGTIRCSFFLLVHGPISVRAYKLGVGAYKQQLMIWKDRRITPFPLHESRDAISQGKFKCIWATLRERIIAKTEEDNTCKMAYWNILELKRLFHPQLFLVFTGLVCKCLFCLLDLTTCKVPQAGCGRLIVKWMTFLQLFDWLKRAVVKGIADGYAICAVQRKWSYRK